MVISTNRRAGHSFRNWADKVNKRLKAFGGLVEFLGNFDPIV
jgi:hypothetical protein